MSDHAPDRCPAPPAGGSSYYFVESASVVVGRTPHTTPPGERGSPVLNVRLFETVDQDTENDMQNLLYTTGTIILMKTKWQIYCEQGQK